ncbi:MAG: ACT domain-containing protein [Anaerolineales bacterium]|nr:ACT domain-containing protein [Anaerolineales bacterium]
MSGETDLSELLKNMKPELNAGEYVYCLADSKEQVVALDPLCYFLEKEGVTMILPKEKADAMSIPYATTCAWITLTVHSSLEAVGLTAAVSKALTEANISCNIVAAFYHDHIFVPIADAPRAMDALFALTKS